MLHAWLSSGNTIFSFPAVTRRVLSHLKEKEMDWFIYFAVLFASPTASFKAAQDDCVLVSLFPPSPSPGEEDAFPSVQMKGYGGQ